MPRRIKAVLKVKGRQTQYWYGVPNNPLGECRLVGHYPQINPTG